MDSDKDDSQVSDDSISESPSPLPSPEEEEDGREEAINVSSPVCCSPVLPESITMSESSSSETTAPLVSVSASTTATTTTTVSLPKNVATPISRPSPPPPPPRGKKNTQDDHRSSRSSELDSGHYSRESSGSKDRWRHPSSPPPPRNNSRHREGQRYRSRLPYQWFRGGSGEQQRTGREPYNNTKRTKSPPPSRPPKASSPRYVDEIVDRSTTAPHVLSFVSKNLMTFATGSLFVLCIRDNGFTLTNGFASHCRDHDAQMHKSLTHVLLSLEVAQVYCTDSSTYNTLKKILSQSTPHHILHSLVYCVLRDFDEDIGVCHECDRVCHRYRATIGTSKHLKFRVKMIPHCVVSPSDLPPPQHPRNQLV